MQIFTIIRYCYLDLDRVIRALLALHSKGLKNNLELHDKRDYGSTLCTPQNKIMYSSSYNYIVLFFCSYYKSWKSVISKGVPIEYELFWFGGATVSYRSRTKCVPWNASKCSPIQLKNKVLRFNIIYPEITAQAHHFRLYIDMFLDCGPLLLYSLLLAWATLGCEQIIMSLFWRTALRNRSIYRRIIIMTACAYNYAHAFV